MRIFGHYRRRVWRLPRSVRAFEIPKITAEAVFVSGTLGDVGAATAQVLSLISSDA
jgi:hypothetical protein